MLSPRAPRPKNERQLDQAEKLLLDLEKIQSNHAKKILEVRKKFKARLHMLTAETDRLAESLVGVPSPQLIVTICRVIECMMMNELQPPEKKLSLTQIAKVFDITMANLSKCLRRFEEKLSASHGKKIRLIERRAGSEKNSVTQEGQMAYIKIKRILQQYADL